MEAALLADDAALLAYAGIDASLPRGRGICSATMAGCGAWRASPRVLFGGGCALLLEVAHPLVAAGVAEHSNFRTRSVRATAANARGGDRARARAARSRRSPRRAASRARTRACAAGSAMRWARSRRARRTTAAIPSSCSGCGRRSSTPRSRCTATSSARSMPARSPSTTAISARSRCCWARRPTARPATRASFRRWFDEMRATARSPSGRRRARSRGAVLETPGVARGPVPLITAALLPDRLRRDFGLRLGRRARAALPRPRRGSARDCAPPPPSTRAANAARLRALRRKLRAASRSERSPAGGTAR